MAAYEALAKRLSRTRRRGLFRRSRRAVVDPQARAQPELRRPQAREHANLIDTAAVLQSPTVQDGGRQGKFTRALTYGIGEPKHPKLVAEHVVEPPSKTTAE